MPGEATPTMDPPPVQEGLAILHVPPGARTERGPGRIDAGPFFNPAMRFNRDLSILVLELVASETTPDRPYRIYDGLAATGARAVRLAKEMRTDRPLVIQANDRDPSAVDVLRRNIAANHVTDTVEATHADFSDGMARRRYDHIDIDPYGSPVPFMDSAIRHLADRATLAITATDVAALCGVYPNVCRRRYGAEPWHGPGMHEVALRILAGSAVRDAARHDVALIPILAHATDHYLRVYLRARRGAGRADAALDRLGHATEHPDGTRRIVTGRHPPDDEAVRRAGPLWGGPLHDKDLVLRLLEKASSRDPPATGLAPYLERVAEEADAPPLYHTVGEWGKRLGVSVPKLDQILQRLRAQGHMVGRTHVAPDAFKTDAPGPDIARAFRG